MHLACKELNRCQHILTNLDKEIDEEIKDSIGRFAHYFGTFDSVAEVLNIAEKRKQTLPIEFMSEDDGAISDAYCSMEDVIKNITRYQHHLRENKGGLRVVYKEKFSPLMLCCRNKLENQEMQECIHMFLDLLSEVSKLVELEEPMLAFRPQLSGRCAKSMKWMYYVNLPISLT